MRNVSVSLSVREIACARSRGDLSRNVESVEIRKQTNVAKRKVGVGNACVSKLNLGEEKGLGAAVSPDDLVLLGTRATKVAVGHSEFDRF